MVERKPLNRDENAERPWSKEQFTGSRVARAAADLPKELVNRLSELRDLYLRIKAEENSKYLQDIYSEINVNGNNYKINLMLGSGVEANSYLTVSDGIPYIIKVFRNPASAEAHVEETKKVQTEGLPVINITDHDFQRGILVFEGKVGIPFDFLLQNKEAGLNSSEELAVLNLYLAFKAYHGLATLSTGNLALNPENRGVFVIDLF